MMLRRFLLIPLLLSIPTLAQVAKSPPLWCIAGGQSSITAGLASTSPIEIAMPSCTVTVNVHNGSLATIYADSSLDPLANPFTANSDSTYGFYALSSQTYDIITSGTVYCVPLVAGCGAGGTKTVTVTLTDVSVGGGGGGGGGGTAITINGGSALPSPVNFRNGTNLTVTNPSGSNVQYDLNNTAVTPGSYTNASITVDQQGRLTAASSGAVSGVSSFNSRTGAVVPVLTDYQGMTQVGTGTLTISKTAGGSFCIGSGGCSGSSSNNWIKFYPDAGGGANILMQDYVGTQIGFTTFSAGIPGTGSGLFLVTNTSGSTQTAIAMNATDISFLAGGTGAGNVDLDMNSSGATWNIVPNFAATGGFKIGGSYGLNGQCVVSTGSAVTFGSCATATVGSVSGTVNQIVNTGTSSAVVLALATPLTLPGNLFGTQYSNGSDFFTITRNTDTSPTGTLLKFLTAASSTLAYVDASGNLFFPSLTTNGSGAGFYGLSQGSNNSASCAANTHCTEAPTSISTSWTSVDPAAGPSAASVVLEGALSGAVSTRSLLPTTATSPTYIQTALASVAGAASGNFATFDGSGNTKNSGVAISQVASGCNVTTIIVPQVCGWVNSTGLTGNLSNTNILTLTAAQPGQYNLSVYLNGTAGCATPGSGQFAAKVTYTDSNGAVTRTAGTLAFSATLPQQQPAVITFWVQSATSTINVSGTYTACSVGTFTLDAHYTLTRIQ